MGGKKQSKQKIIQKTKTTNLVTQLNRVQTLQKTKNTQKYLERGGAWKNKTKQQVNQ